MWRILTNRRFLWGLAVVAALLAVALWPRALPVDTAQATRGPMGVTVDEEGETRVRDVFVVSAPVAGRMERIELEPGDAVVRGSTVLARLTPGDPALLDARSRAELASSVDAARAALGQAQAERDEAATALARARSARQRIERVHGKGVVSDDEFDEAETAVRTAEEASRAAEFNAARAEYELRVARARLARPEDGGRTLVLTAPVDGVVLKRHRESAGVVSMGELLLEIGDPGRLEVVADLLSTDAVRVSEGDAVRLEHWGGETPLKARVRRVEPGGFMKVSALGVEEQRVNVRIDFEAPPETMRRLGDGYRVEVRIVIWQQPDVLRVPIGALFRHGDRWALFVVEGGRARLSTVGIGQRNSQEAQVIEGIDPGDEVVVHPPDTLRDGMRITRRQG
jgi:HlyD family secretion protein